MRDVNLSQENLAVQWQYVKRNLKELGVAGNFDDFERKEPIRRYRGLSRMMFMMNLPNRSAPRDMSTRL